MNATISDSLFLTHSKSAFLGGSNHASPTFFEWQREVPGRARFVTDSDIKYARGRGQIAWLLEPCELHPENYAEAKEKGFSAVLTHNRFLAQKNGWLFYPHGGSWTDFSAWGMQEKTKFCSLLLSEKNSLPGHKLRHQIAEKFEGKIDVLGIKRRVSTFDAYAPYRYSVVVENHRGSCFTERVIDCMSVGTIPIYWGCDDLDRYFARPGFISFETVDDLELISRSISRTDDYNKRLDFAEFNLATARKYAIVEDWIFEHYPYLFEGEL